jgi:hypothetical protein
MKKNNLYPAILTKLKSKLNSFKLSPKIVFILMGIASTLWFLIRVIPKPQRAAYPCMQAAAPVMSGFVIYLVTLAGSVMFFKKAFSRFKQGHYLAATFAFASCIVLLVIFNMKDAQEMFSSPQEVSWDKGVLPEGPNKPMGTGFGIFPGRVVWVRNPDATRDACINTITDAYFMAKNNDQAAINNMADKAILSVGGQATVKESWDAIFKSFNKKKTGVGKTYSEGETVFIKINNGQAGWAINWSNLAEKGNDSSTGVKNAAMSNTTPATVVAIVRQLVDELGIPQEKIMIAEPMTHLYKSLYDAIHPVYPNVILLDKDNYSNLGRTKSSGWKKDVIYYSDYGDDMPDAIKDAIMNEMNDADYLIPISALKAHARAGVTLTAKLHFGTHGDHPGYGFGSAHLHAGLISTVDNDVLTTGVRGEYGMYRVLTDLMGHEKLGLNSLIFIVDGLWGGIEATDMPVKWKTAPFNNDWPSSLFVSQDAVALESVCIDFLRAEANINTAFKNRPFFPAVDDHLHQAADKANWAAGVTYDPEGDGTEMPASLGVHEHWNNDTDKKYSKNLSPEGKGIELVEISGSATGVGSPLKSLAIEKVTAYPNPCSSETEISFYLKNNASVEYQVVSMEGKTMYSVKNQNLSEGKHSQRLNMEKLSRGTYIIVVKTVSGKASGVSTLRLLVN